MDPEDIQSVLEPDFQEIGTSGRVWDRSGILELLETVSGHEAEIEVHELTVRKVGDGLAMATWISKQEGRRARRSSLWRAGDTDWQLVHHQGTLIPEADRNFLRLRPSTSVGG